VAAPDVSVAVPLDLPVAFAEPSRSDPRPERFERHVLDGNIAVVFMGRYGLTYHLLPLVHHALVVTAYRQTPGFIEPDALNGGLLGAGGEIGWRLYTGSRGPTGLYLGLSALGAYHTTDKAPWFGTYGAAAEAGTAFILGNGYHLVIGGGAELRKADVDNDALTDIARLFVGSGIAPRFTIALGHTLSRRP
jgi:hypothetical protein